MGRYFRNAMMWLRKQAVVSTVALALWGQIVRKDDPKVDDPSPLTSRR